MAAVVKARPKNPPADTTEPNMEAAGATQLTAPLLSSAEERAESVVVDIEAPHSRQTNGNKHHSVQQNDKPSNGVGRSSEDIEEGEVIGIITLEDVFEELLQVSCRLANLFSGMYHCFVFLLYRGRSNMWFISTKNTI